MTSILGLHRTGSKISVTTIASFAASTNARDAYKQFCRNLYQIGVTEDELRQKENEILEILRPQSILTSTQTGNSGVQGRFLGEGSIPMKELLQVRPLTCKQAISPSRQKLSLRLG